MSRRNIIGWCYDKNGNICQVHAPINAQGKIIKPDHKTHCGSLLHDFAGRKRKKYFKIKK